MEPFYLSRPLSLDRLSLFHTHPVFQDALPHNDYFEYYGPDYRLHMPVSNMENLNTPEYLDSVKVIIMLQMLSVLHLGHLCPSALSIHLAVLVKCRSSCSTS